MKTYINTTSASNTLITKASERFGNIKSITIANRSANEADCDLYVDNDSVQYYYFENLKIPSGVTFVFDERSLRFNSSKYALKLQNNGSSPSLTIMIND